MLASKSDIKQLMAIRDVKKAQLEIYKLLSMKLSMSISKQLQQQIFQITNSQGCKRGKENDILCIIIDLDQYQQNQSNHSLPSDKNVLNKILSNISQVINRSITENNVFINKQNSQCIICIESIVDMPLFTLKQKINQILINESINCIQFVPLENKINLSFKQSINDTISFKNNEEMQNVPKRMRNNIINVPVSLLKWSILISLYIILIFQALKEKNISKMKVLKDYQELSLPIVIGTLILASLHILLQVVKYTTCKKNIAIQIEQSSQDSTNSFQSVFDHIKHNIPQQPGDNTIDDCVSPLYNAYTIQNPTQNQQIYEVTKTTENKNINKSQLNNIILNDSKDHNDSNNQILFTPSRSSQISESTNENKNIEPFDHFNLIETKNKLMNAYNNISDNNQRQIANQSESAPTPNFTHQTLNKEDSFAYKEQQLPKNHTPIFQIYNEQDKKTKAQIMQQLKEKLSTITQPEAIYQIKSWIQTFNQMTLNQISKISNIQKHDLIKIPELSKTAYEVVQNSEQMEFSLAMNQFSRFVKINIPSNQIIQHPQLDFNVLSITADQWRCFFNDTNVFRAKWFYAQNQHFMVIHKISDGSIYLQYLYENQKTEVDNLYFQTKTSNKILFFFGLKNNFVDKLQRQNEQYDILVNGIHADFNAIQQLHIRQLISNVKINKELELQYPQDIIGLSANYISIKNIHECKNLRSLVLMNTYINQMAFEGITQLQNLYLQDVQIHLTQMNDNVISDDESDNSLLIKFLNNKNFQFYHIHNVNEVLVKQSLDGKKQSIEIANINESSFYLNMQLNIQYLYVAGNATIALQFSQEDDNDDLKQLQNTLLIAAGGGLKIYGPSKPVERFLEQLEH